jgi:glycosyltransferase involved in cell wall biosynthesis
VALDNKTDLTILLPCYNKVDSIIEVIHNLSDLLNSQSIPFKIIVIDDGSVDGTTELLNLVSHDYLEQINLSQNFGKGYAIRIGLEKIATDLVAVFDADLDLNPVSLLEAYGLMINSPDIDIVIGSKLHKDSKVFYPISRRVMSYFYQIFIKLLFNLNITDTQVGMKMFRTRAINSISPKLSVNGFAIDLEILVLANNMGLMIKEIPVSISHQFNSTVNLFSIVKIIQDTITIKIKVIFQK